MRLGVNASFYSPARVGVNVWIENVVRELVPRYDLVVYTSVPSAFAALPVTVRPIAPWTRSHWGRMCWAYLHLPRKLRQDRVDLVLSASCEAPVRVGVPSIAVVHDLTPLVVRGSMSLRYTFLFWLSLQFLRGCDAVITDSEHSRNDLLRLRLFPRHRVRVIHCGRRFPIAGSNPTLAISAARPYLLYVGGFLRHKNVALLISAFEVLARELPHQLVLVGWATDSILRPLRELVRRHGLTDRVSFRQDLSDEELSVLYRDCELFVFPSRYEGFGFPVLEAMACGAPVLCSNSSSLPEIGGDAVEYFNPESGPEMVSAMRRLLGDPARRQELSAQGKTRSRLFAPERTAAAIGELADELLRAGNEVPVQRSRE